MVTTTLVTVFKKMVDYGPLLPDDATKWSFCLPSMFYNSLTQEVKTEMQIQDYQIPQPSLLPTKKDQLQSMSTCRSMAGQAVRKVKQVQASVAAMINNQITGIKFSGHHLRLQQNIQVNSYNQHSRAEDTIKREQDRKRRASACPVGFVQKFVTSNGVDYPCHPADEAQHSPYPAGFR